MLAYIGLGSNLGDREATIRRALELLGEVPGTRVVAVSTLRETEPWGLEDQPPFLNGACVIETSLPPKVLLEELLAIEETLGRVRGGVKYGPRTIDLDLLLYADAAIDLPGLTVPHARLAERRFALEPLVELDPALVVPGHGRVDALLATLD
jgi:2-amino-4-hydroxy-6-hydroxymethyldihydropteridine diphosphokinase